MTQPTVYTVCDQLERMVRTGQTPKRTTLAELARDVRDLLALEAEVAAWRQRYEAKSRELDALRQELNLLKAALRSPT